MFVFLYCKSKIVKEKVDFYLFYISYNQITVLLRIIEKQFLFGTTLAYMYIIIPFVITVYVFN